MSKGVEKADVGRFDAFAQGDGYVVACGIRIECDGGQPVLTYSFIIVDDYDVKAEIVTGGAVGDGVGEGDGGVVGCVGIDGDVVL